MATNLVATSKKLVSALNVNGYNLTFSCKQFMGRDKRTHTMYCVSQAVYDDSKKRYNHNEIYSTSSMIRITLFLRDMWFMFNKWELPRDQEQWNVIRKGLMEDGKYRTRPVQVE